MTAPTTDQLWTWRSGPDCNGRARLAPGRYVVGRAGGAELRCDDPALAPFHALLELRAGAPARVVQLAGGRPLPEHSAGGPLEIGSSVLTTAPCEAHRGTAHVRDGALQREPRAAPAWDDPQLREPDPPAGRAPHHGTLLPALAALAAASAIAAVTRRPMFAVFGAIGATVALSTWAAQRIGGGREQRRAVQRYAEALAELAGAADRTCAGFLACHRARTPTVADAVETIEARTAALWSRRAEHPDAYLVSIGVGDLLWQPAGLDATRARLLSDEPIAAWLGPGARLAIRGEEEAARSVGRGLLAQLLASCGPADLHLVVVTDGPGNWSWLDGVPHVLGGAGSALIGDEDETQRMVDELVADGRRHVLVVTDRAEVLATRTHPLRRFVMGEQAPALIALVPPGAAVPHVCTAQLHLTQAGGVPAAQWVASTDGTLPQHVRTAGLSAGSATRLAERLRPIRDPEDPLAAGSAIPAEVDLRELLSARDGGALTAAAIAASWLAGDNDPPPRTVIGRAADGVVDVDLVRDGPHALLAGTTGSGKSELLRSLVVGMARAASPAHLTFVLVDYKGGATFDGLAALPHVVGIVTDLDARLADRALRSLQAELRHREERLRAYGAPDLAAFRELAAHEVLPRLVVIIDEFAALVAEQPEFLDALVGVAQRGRSLGMHLILATQRPQGVITEAIRANTNLRLALRLQDAADAHDVVGDPAPASLPRRRPGRAVLRLGPDELLEFQTARLGADDPLVTVIGGAWKMAGGAAPRRPWQPPLPAMVAPAGGRLGLVDDPDRQAIVDLRWHPDDGNLVLAGATGTGLSTALAAVGAAALGDPATHLYVIDASGGDRLRALGTAPRCAAVVGVHEHERLARLLARLAAGGPSPARPVLLIDGFPALRQHLDDLETVEEYDALERILTAPGTVSVIAADRPSAVPPAVLARCGQRWVFHLRDAHDAATVGLSPASVPGAGTPGRILISPGGLEAQLALPGPVPTDGPAAAPIEVMSSSVGSAGLPRSTAAHGTCRLVCGQQFATGVAARLAVHDGEHLLVIGPARSGRSTALTRLTAAWRQAQPRGQVFSIRSPRSPYAGADHSVDDASALAAAIEAAGDRPVLAVIDDAEGVDDPGGRLAALAASRRLGVLLLAAGRPDALRQSYGHWTTVVRRSRLGIAMSGCNDLDGDLLGAALPRRLPVRPRPGLGWLVGDGPPLLTQLAIEGP